jgi:GNAT superfamily N-acetyltransferase
VTPVAEDPDRPCGRVLLDARGGALGSFVAGEREGRPLADRFRLAARVAPADAVARIGAELKGWIVAGEPALGRALIDAGARVRRHAHVMSRDLVRDPAPSDWLEPVRPAGVRLTGVDRPALDLAPACRAAYPPEHPDYPGIPTPERPELELEEMIAGRLMGPLLPASGLAIAPDGSVAGAILVHRTAGEPPYGGPWIGQFFRHPDARGLGAPLLRRALAIATRDGLPALGLAVTHGNPASALYAALGFEDVRETISVQV